MRKFSQLVYSLVLLGVVLLSYPAQARTLLSDAPFPWGSEVSLYWPALNGTWVAETGSSSPLIFKFKVVERGGGIYLVTSQVSQQLRIGTVIAQGYAFVVADQKYINIPYFGEGIVPLAILRKYPVALLGSGKETLTITWVWDANSPTFVHRHFVLEKISNESEL